jgi:hypothetical protein
MRLFALILVSVGLAACQQAKAPPPAQSAATASSATQGATPAKLARIAFLDQETACDCTKKGIDASWAALQSALGPAASLAVERIHVDTEAAKAEPGFRAAPARTTAGHPLSRRKSF